MAEIRTGRWTARFDGPYVVFLIGMRINRWWKVHRWLPIVLAMTRMLRELYPRPELGFMGGNSWFGRTIIVVQYWRSFEDLEHYAKARDHQHLPAWAAFNRAIGSNGDVGVYHETYRVTPGGYENVYVNMPPFLAGAVAELEPATGRKSSARDRMETVEQPAS